ncbi:DUF1893 domain-containing protein [Bifidobacterium leontopitheci]|uniref:DUF1893 domain-containing protein n=1 Tax=Bifidobacterium leontopitheci TaxID=2650774 RepID=A0A6I1GVD2_9BIFI|nr:DUF1893 domain-containing protein [Bifidobacterium leontopitheci]KAB7790411.1 hypothetical protein F7D09_1097 [Bifidobacterium leontopitheci]
MANARCDDDLTCARAKLLADDALGCVACRGGETLTGTGRGVRPLLVWLAEGRRLDGFAAADRVVGKGAALLYVRLGVRSVWSAVMSEAGLSALQANGIGASYGSLVPVIENRARTGMCPIERSVADIDDPAAAEPAIRAAVARLMAARA